MTLEASIIITSYNMERYIARAVASALAQVGVQFEVIAVDDASTDGTWELLKAFDDARIRSFRLEMNRGPGGARNKGINKAQGEWIVILDGDDALEPERVARCIERAKATGAALVVDNVMVCREADGKEFPMFAPGLFAKLEKVDLALFIRGKLSRYGYALGYLKPIFSAAFLREHELGYEENLRIGEDYLIVAQALALGAVCAVELATGYRYTLRAGSISHRLSVEAIESMQVAHAAFGARFALAGKARKEFDKRSAVLTDMAAYAQLVAAIKACSLRSIIGVMTTKPAAARHLWQPVWKRLKGA